ncbi:hypothetical protein SLE2022_255200 [Rubroshorea leprosula]
MKKEKKLLKKSLEKERVELTELEARFTQLRAERRHALEESEWTQTCLDIVEALLPKEQRISSATLSPVTYDKEEFNLKKESAGKG